MSTGSEVARAVPVGMLDVPYVPLWVYTFATAVPVGVRALERKSRMFDRVPSPAVVVNDCPAPTIVPLPTCWSVFLFESA